MRHAGLKRFFFPTFRALDLTEDVLGFNSVCVDGETHVGSRLLPCRVSIFVSTPRHLRDELHEELRGMDLALCWIFVRMKPHHEEVGRCIHAAQVVLWPSAGAFIATSIHPCLRSREIQPIKSSPRHNLLPPWLLEGNSGTPSVNPCHSNYIHQVSPV